MSETYLTPCCKMPFNSYVHDEIKFLCTCDEEYIIRKGVLGKWVPVEVVE